MTAPSAFSHHICSIWPGKKFWFCCRICSKHGKLHQNERYCTILALGLHNSVVTKVTHNFISLLRLVTCDEPVLWSSKFDLNRALWVNFLWEKMKMSQNRFGCWKYVWLSCKIGSVSTPLWPVTNLCSLYSSHYNIIFCILLHFRNTWDFSFTFKGLWLRGLL